MAKAATKELATRDDNTLPAELLELAKQDAGKGLSTRQEDNITPIIYFLQSNSKAVDPNEPSYIDGAKPGDILLRGMDQPIVSGKEGVWFQPSFFCIRYNEWIPRDNGGGFVASHSELPAEAEKVVDPSNPNKVKWRMPNGNEVLETRIHAGFVHNHGPVPLPFVLSLTSTGHTFSRQWMFAMNQKRTPDGDAWPSWAYLYRIRTVPKQNKQGKWHAPEIVESTPVTSRADYERGKVLHQAFASGQRDIEAPMEDPTGDDEAAAAERAGL